MKTDVLVITKGNFNAIGVSSIMEQLVKVTKRVDMMIKHCSNES